MAAINTKNVHRTHALLGHPWGRDFRYDERMLTGEGPAGERRARALVRRARVQAALLAKGYRIGRTFPPYGDWCRVSVGTGEEMRGVCGVMGEVLRG
jgi:hypothetical protein